MNWSAITTWIGVCILVAAGIANGAQGYGPTLCEVCGEPIANVAYTVQDRVTKSNKVVCSKCITSLPRCFTCGVPALTNAPGALRLEDMRWLCSRDASTAVLDLEIAKQILQEVRQQMTRQFSRFTTFSGADISFLLMDRLHLDALFKAMGPAYDCPNVFGLTFVMTNGAVTRRAMSVLTGLPPGVFRAVCAHEIAHVWIDDNVTEARRRKLSQPAKEGFCELMAYLCADALQDERTKADILGNGYTRGQVAAFIEAERQYGVNEVLEWMQHGIDDRIIADDLSRIRTLEPKTTSLATISALPAATYKSAPKPIYDSLVLKAILWDARHPSALINDSTLFAGDDTVLKLSGTNVPLRCLEVQKDSVRVKWLRSGQEQVLRLDKGR